MLKAARHKEIITLLHGGGVVEVNALAIRFQTSPITVRRDLIELHERGLVERTRGGAVSGEVIAEGWARYESISYAERERENVREKRAIAELAAQHVSDGDCILVNAGTTSRHFAEALRGHHNLHVVTNGLTVAMEFARSQNASVYLLPGTVDFKKMASVSRPAPGAFDDITVRAAFLGVNGISPSGGISMLSPEEAAMNRAFIEAAQTVTVLVDSSKFNSQAIFRIAHLDKVTRIITDVGIDQGIREKLEKLSVEVLVASPDDASP
ncbi:MAG: DeoR family transcriptional regulator [Polaromonas sp. 39-63-203]|jgi:DeoR/GlpR family transcriptional regulator of sugar metabolism|uniref:DeoR/GlpR family DNA-binding transcription regulator n=1 Tax=Polaromonas sp. TaxID=1869339 RepID=UPI000BCE18B7|nr:DeoR/GlpR family DNA-binding transcription regulator [Polaromonas sp.]OYY52931.1 MAG: DeoR family transcriptional regulator [Polaromonas sp. 35-63-240]OYZ01307.1 MAG: DeoR family transcriptional regulator [Polaromonas sp. 28-63-22]OYZ84745.1 MAG: DeoR family transcriptional regulator [Polaromonas sp. 24-62-144]OZA98687.1 MAG: DeoR family transcriptional regulator [Polaromonas sp. 39-63-203]HQS31289.1 DeoR/GlpR family DNA-binding transcription regulator [Polaromonas sp.]